SDEKLQNKYVLQTESIKNDHRSKTNKHFTLSSEPFSAPFGSASEVSVPFNVVVGEANSAPVRAKGESSPSLLTGLITHLLTSPDSR
ncbi:hypothetical protein Tco_0476657, partial [Tanacetum coccineum]